MTPYIGYIYKYAFPNNKLYIGQTTRSVGVRFNEHLYSSTKGEGYYLHRAINKYGKENIVIDIICTVGASGLKELNDLLNKLEIFFISYYNCVAPKGYNLKPGGEVHRGYKLPKEFGEKISRKNKGHSITKEQRKKLSESLKGHKVSQETKDKISKANKGKPCPQHVREKTSKTFKGKAFSQEHKDKISKALTGRRLSSETVQKLKDSKIKAIQQYNKQGELLFTYKCIEDASKNTGISMAAIYKCACGKNKTSGGYIWRYIK